MVTRRFFRQFPLLLLVPLALAGCVAGRPGAAGAGKAAVAGKATVNGVPVAGVQLSAYPLETASLTGAAPYRSALTGADGHYVLHLPPGAYYLIARGKGLFSYYGRNPVTVPATGLQQLNLSLLHREPSRPQIATRIRTGIVGRVTAQGKPLPWAVIYLYPDLTSQLKGMGLGPIGPTRADGIFLARLRPGTYYVVARCRQSHEIAGPLNAGDFMGYYPQNPIVVHPGEVVRLTLPMLEVPQKVARLAATLFGQTNIRGRILDAAGRPVAGVRALLYANPTMLNRPLYVSQPTGPDGRYVLSFPKGGTYYIAARNTLGGAPVRGDLYGVYEGNPEHAVHIKTGERSKGLDITVGKVL